MLICKDRFIKYNFWIAFVAALVFLFGLLVYKWSFFKRPSSYKIMNALVKKVEYVNAGALHTKYGTSSNYSFLKLELELPEGDIRTVILNTTGQQINISKGQHIKIRVEKRGQEEYVSILPLDIAFQ